MFGAARSTKGSRVSKSSFSDIPAFPAQVKLLADLVRVIGRELRGSRKLRSPQVPRGDISL